MVDIINFIGKLKIRYLAIILVWVLTPLIVFWILYKGWIFTTYTTCDSIPIIIWWSQFMPNNTHRIIHCGQSRQCIVTANKTYQEHHGISAYLFYGSHLDTDDFPLPRNYAVSWGVFHEESPKNYGPFLYKDVQDLFNFTATFSRHSNFPLTLQYLTHDLLHLLVDQKYLVPVEEKNKFGNAPILFIQSDCDNPLNRDSLIKELMQFVQIDSYGKCLRNRKFPESFSKLNSLDIYNEELLKFTSTYKFTIAFENSICYDYITEKLWRPLIAGSVPIYLGSPTIEDWLPNNSSAILAKNFPNMQDLAEYIIKIHRNDTLYNSFLKHKWDGLVTNERLRNTKYLHSQSEGHPITDFECYVCQKIHDKSKFSNSPFNVYDCPKPEYDHENTWDQHWDMGKCQAKALRYLMEKDIPFSYEQYYRTWQKFLNKRSC